MEITFNWVAENASQRGFNKAWQPHFAIDNDLLYDERKNHTVKRVYYLFAEFKSQLEALLVRKPLATKCNVAHYKRMLLLHGRSCNSAPWDSAAPSCLKSDFNIAK